MMGLEFTKMNSAWRVLIQTSQSGWGSPAEWKTFWTQHLPVLIWTVLWVLNWFNMFLLSSTNYPSETLIYAYSIMYMLVHWCILFFIVIQSLSHVWLFAILWTAARQASLSFTISQSLLKLMSIESVMPSNHILCRPPFPPALNLSQHQGLFWWVSSLHQVAKVLELQHQCFQYTFRVDFL